MISINNGIKTGWSPIWSVIIHSTHYLFSDWLKAYSEFSADNPYIDFDYSGYHKNLIQ